MTDVVEPPREHERRTLPIRGLILYALAGLATVGFIAIAERVLEGHADAFDREWALAIHRADAELLDWLFIAFTTIGSDPYLWGAIALVGLLAIRKRRWRFAVVLVANGVIAFTVNQALKHWFMRQRPALFDEITRPETFSFPSGHAMSAVVMMGAIAAVVIALYPRLRTVVVSIAIVLATGSGLSRIYLGVHWPTDVLAGFASGVPFLVVTVHMIHRIGRSVDQSK